MQWRRTDGMIERKATNLTKFPLYICWPHPVNSHTIRMCHCNPVTSPPNCFDRLMGPTRQMKMYPEMEICKCDELPRL
jgi:hypothetical protein